MPFFAKRSVPIHNLHSNFALTIFIMHVFWTVSVISVLFNCIVVIAAFPTPSDILTYVNEANESGYHFKYETKDQQFREETGELVTRGDEKLMVVHGQYSYEGRDGFLYKVSYRADANGFRANTTKIILIAPQVNSVLLASLAGGGIG